MSAKKKVEMPSRITLGGRGFTIEVDPGLEAHDTVGLYSGKAGRISIVAGMNEDQAKAVVFHELFHDFDYQSAYNLSEVQVNSLAALAFAALRDNPGLVAWLMS